MSDIDWEVRLYRDDDAKAVRSLLVEAFATENEANLAEALRADGDQEIELIAHSGDTIVGYVVLSKMQSPARSLGLGPVATALLARKQGVAASLIESSLALAAAHDWTTVFLLGDANFYERFGFDAEAATAFPSPYSGPHWQVAFLNEDEAPRAGKADYARAFTEFS
ncbi:MAG: N-acetyltransferase [Pseudomonadota bacterium]